MTGTPALPTLDEVREKRRDSNAARMARYDGDPQAQAEVTLGVVGDLVGELAGVVDAWQQRGGAS